MQRLYDLTHERPHSVKIIPINLVDHYPPKGDHTDTQPDVFSIDNLEMSQINVKSHH